MSRRSLGWGALAGGLLAGFYVTVIAASAGWQHLADTVAEDWYLVLPLVLGFAVQVGLLAEVRRRHRAAHATALVTGAGAGTSAVGMVACCAHHLVDLVSLTGLTGTATFLTSQQRTLLWVALGATALGLALAVKQLRRAPAPQAAEAATGKELTCAH